MNKTFTAVVLFSLTLNLAIAQQKTITAHQVIETIKKNLTCDWMTETVDTFKSGNPEDAVTGIAVCMFADMEILRQAVANNCNLIITHEPVFYNHADQTTQLQNNPVWQEKMKFINDNKLIIWRFHDHWHMTSPDGIYFGMIRKLGWEKYLSGQAGYKFILPETDLKSFATALQRRFNTNTFRVIGDPNLKFTKVSFMAGAPGGQRHVAILGQDDTEVLVAGEAPEWETYMFANDARQQGKKKAVVFMGHIPSEEAGMEYCAEWLSSFVKEVPVKFIANKEVFWIP
jgi:putative NIF3 family GTP cyclohydrolase 1 type 2